jgi:D-3-phosphoglycerate dehydrogenase
VPQQIIRYVNTGSSMHSVNFPGLRLPELADAHRLIHIHENRPGILAQINNVFAENHINILGQYLKTNETVGYVITDIETAHDKKIVRDLRKIPHTIRFRVLY